MEKKIKPTFEKPYFDKKSITIEQTNNECTIFQIVHLKGEIFNIVPKGSVNKKGHPITFKQVTIKHSRNPIAVTMFGDLCENNKKSKNYTFSNIRVSKYMVHRLLKSTSTIIQKM